MGGRVAGGERGVLYTLGFACDSTGGQRTCSGQGSREPRLNVFGDKVLSVRACVCLFGGDGIRGPDCGLWNRYVVSPVARRELQLARAHTPSHLTRERTHGLRKLHWGT